MAQETIPVQGLGTASGKLDYDVSAGQVFDLMAAFATFDGSVAGAFLPAIQVLAPSGAVMVSTVGASVAAGGSADVTFAPFLENDTTGTTPVSSTGLAWAANLSGTINFADTGFNIANVSMAAGNFVTNDATVFAEHTSVGVSGIRALVQGYYFIWVTVLATTQVAPTAGAFIKCRTTSPVGQEFNSSLIGPWLQTDSTPSWQACATYGWGAVVQSPSSPAPETFFLAAGQNSGATVALEAWMQVVQISTKLL